MTSTPNMTTTKGGTAVMNRRREGPDALDDFPTPPWGTRALCEFLYGRGHLIGKQDVWEPCANRGYMVRPLLEYFDRVCATDVYDYGVGFPVQDFLFPGIHSDFSWIITNPPFRLATEIALTAIDRASQGVALLLRSNWLEGGDRYRQIFQHKAPTFHLQFSERLPMVKGRCDQTASTATSYSWFIWDTRGGLFRNNATTTLWIPPGSRKALERPGDYDIPKGAI